MAQTTISIRTDAALKEDFERLCHDIGMNVSTAFNIFMKQSVHENRIPVSLKGSSSAYWEDLKKGVEELNAGKGIRKTMAELEAMEDE